MLLLDKPLSYTRSSYMSDVFCDELLLIQDIGYMSNTASYGSFSHIMTEEFRQINMITIFQYSFSIVLALGWCPLIPRYFCKGFDCGEKEDLSNSYRNPKRKMWVTTNFSEIIKQPQFQNSFKIQRMYGHFFSKFKLSYL